MNCIKNLYYSYSDVQLTSMESCMSMQKYSPRISPELLGYGICLPYASTEFGHFFNNLRLYSGLITVYKFSYCGSAKDYGLLLSSTNMRVNRVQLIQRSAKTHTTSYLLSCRTPIAWNSLPLKISCVTIHLLLKKLLKQYLI